ncbi:MAG TPA: hypothetical protein ENJ80_10970 [Gammaproteobacteria bacterium]|nr:hypothetical protein [Gammaproteobacteria bacterium]
MNIKLSSTRMLLAVILATTLPAAQAATAMLYGDRAAFLSELGAAVLSQQDFEGFADGSDMSGVQFLPGITASTNLEKIGIFQGSGDKELFIQTRNKSQAIYDIILSQPYQALGFDIEAFDPATPGPGFLDVFFTDGDILTDIPVLPLNASEQDPLFFGVIADTDIQRIRWSEGPEIGGTSCCEETALDNFVAVSAVPLPAALPLFAASLIGLTGISRRRSPRIAGTHKR